MSKADVSGGDISASKAAVLLTGRLDRVVTADRVRTVLWELRGGKGPPDATGEWRVTPAETDVLHGEILIRSAPWWRRGLAQSERRAWVDGVLVRVPGGDPPWARYRGTQAGQVLEPTATWLPISEWPTGRVIGRLVLSDEVREGYPVYTRVPLPDRG